MLSVVFWVLREADYKGICALAECVLASFEGSRSHILVKQSTV